MSQHLRNAAELVCMFAYSRGFARLSNFLASILGLRCKTLWGGDARASETAWAWSPQEGPRSGSNEQSAQSRSSRPHQPSSGHRSQTNPSTQPAPVCHLQNEESWVWGCDRPAIIFSRGSSCLNALEVIFKRTRI